MKKLTFLCIVALNIIYTENARLLNPVSSEPYLKKLQQLDNNQLEGSGEADLHVRKPRLLNAVSSKAYLKKQQQVDIEEPEGSGDDPVITETNSKKLPNVNNDKLESRVDASFKAESNVRQPNPVDRGPVLRKPLQQEDVIGSSGDAMPSNPENREPSSIKPLQHVYLDKNDKNDETFKKPEEKARPLNSVSSGSYFKKQLVEIVQPGDAIDCALCTKHCNTPTWPTKQQTCPVRIEGQSGCQTKQANYELSVQLYVKRYVNLLLRYTDLAGIDTVSTKDYEVLTKTVDIRITAQNLKKLMDVYSGKVQSMPLQEIDGILSRMFQKSLKDELKTSFFSTFSWFYVPDWNWFQVANFSILALCVVYSYYCGIRAVFLPSICAFILVEAVQMYFNKLTEAEIEYIMRLKKRASLNANCSPVEVQSWWWSWFSSSPSENCGQQMKDDMISTSATVSFFQLIVDTSMKHVASVFKPFGDIVANFARSASGDSWLGSLIYPFFFTVVILVFSGFFLVLSGKRFKISVFGLTSFTVGDDSQNPQRIYEDDSRNRQRNHEEVQAPPPQPSIHQNPQPQSPVIVNVNISHDLLQAARTVSMPALDRPLPYTTACDAPLPITSSSAQAIGFKSRKQEDVNILENEDEETEFEILKAPSPRAQIRKKPEICRDLEVREEEVDTIEITESIETAARTKEAEEVSWDSSTDSEVEVDRSSQKEKVEADIMAELRILRQQLAKMKKEDF